MKEAAPQESRAQRDASAQRAWESARRAMQLALPGLLRRAGVVGVDLGLKRSAGQLLPGPSLCIHVERKIPDEELHPRRRLPSRIGRFPVGSLDQVTVMAGDPDVFGRVYLGFKGSGWVYGEPARCDPAPYRLGDTRECVAIP